MKKKVAIILGLFFSFPLFASENSYANRFGYVNAGMSLTAGAPYPSVFRDNGYFLIGGGYRYQKNCFGCDANLQLLSDLSTVIEKLSLDFLYYPYPAKTQFYIGAGPAGFASHYVDGPVVGSKLFNFAPEIILGMQFDSGHQHFIQSSVIWPVFDLHEKNSAPPLFSVSYGWGF
jgi:hypothetical protein